MCARVCVWLRVWGWWCVCFFGHVKAPARLAVCLALRAGAVGVSLGVGLGAWLHVNTRRVVYRVCECPLVGGG
jgi:hypothetical protein